MNRLFIIIIAVLLSLTSLFGYLSYTFYSDKATLKADVDRLVKANATLVSDVEKATKSCLIVDEINTENIQEQKEIDTKKEELVEKVDSLPSLPNCPSIQSKAPKKATDKESSYVEDSAVLLDSRLPDELIKLLQQSYNSVQEQSTPNPR